MRSIRNNTLVQLPEKLGYRYELPEGSFPLMGTSVSQSAFGIRGDSEFFHNYNAEGPRMASQGDSFIVPGGGGYDIQNFKITDVQASILSIAGPGKRILDIGSAFGYFANQCLEKGAEVVANDRERGPLIWRVNMTPDAARSRLHINDVPVQTLDLPEESFDAILMHRMLHLLNEGWEVQNTLNKCLRWLKPGGTLGIVAMSIFNTSVGDDFYPNIYKQRVMEGDPWPGSYLEMLPQFKRDAQKYVHLFELDSLRTALEITGYEIDSAKYVSLAKRPDDSDSKDLTNVSIIARRP